jgi:hypothetical protein
VHPDTVPDPQLHTRTQYQTHNYRPGHSTRPTLVHLDTVPDPQLHTWTHTIPTHIWTLYKTHTYAPGHSTRPTLVHLDTVPDPHIHTWTHIRPTHIWTLYKIHTCTPGLSTRPTLVHLIQYQTHNYTPGHIPDPHTFGHCTKSTLVHLDTVPDQHLKSFLTRSFSLSRIYKIFWTDEISENYAQIQLIYPQ